jgi:transcription initiation factor TFIIF subunit beta
MLLRSDLAQHQNVPKEYDLDITAEKVDNTFIFTEKDLPGFKSKSQIPFDPEMANMPARLTRPKFPKGSPDKTPWKVNKTYQPYFRRAIPKKTTLAGRVAHEVNCIAVTNPESERLLAQRTIEAMRPKAGTIFLQGDNTKLANGFIEPGTMSAMGAFGGFIVCSLM